MELTEQIQKLKIVPVVVLANIEDTEPTMQALCDGGLPVAEITFRTECAAAAIRLACEKFPEMLIGAGTVVRADQAEHAIACGAKFIVGPRLFPCGGRGLPQKGRAVSARLCHPDRNHCRDGRGAGDREILPCLRFRRSWHHQGAFRRVPGDALSPDRRGQ